MAQTILIKRSNTSGAVPTTSQLSVGELALNTRDGKIYMRKYVDGTTGNDTITLIGDTSTIAATTLTGNLSMGDNVRAIFGTGNDLQIYHDGSNSYINENGTGDLIIKGGGTLRLQGSASTELANFSTGAGVTLFHNNVSKFATTSYGADITGRLVTTSHIDAPDDARIRLGDGDDLQFYHDGSNSYIQHGTTGNFNFTLKGGTEFALIAANDGPVTLYHNNVSKFATQSYGALVSGVLLANNGSAAAPAFSFSNDSDTGMYRNSADIVAFATGGARRGYWASSGLHSDSNVYTGSGGTFRNYAGVWSATTGTTGNGFSFVNSVDGTAMTLSSTGSAVFSGSVTANAGVVVDNITIDANKIATNQASGHSGDFTIDAAGDIILDADGGDVRLKDNGTEFLNFYAGTIERTGSLVFDVSGNITLNADGSTISLADGSLNFGQFYQNASGALNIYAPTQDKDIVFLGNDGGSTVTALRLDMSAAGEAIFNSDIRLFDSKAVRFGTDQDFRISNDGSHTTLQNSTADQDILIKGNDGGSTITALTLDMSNAGKATFSGIVSSAQGFERGNMFITQNEIDVSSGNLHIDVASSIILDSDAGNVYLRDSGTDVGLLSMANTDLYIRSLVSDRDIIFQGYDGSSNITALTLDMSDAGAALFNSTIALGDNKHIFLGAGNDGRISFDGNNTLNISAANGTANTVNITANNFEIGGANTLISGVANDSVVINEDSGNISFRVESNNNTSMLFVDGTNDKVGIGTSAPASLLNLSHATAPELRFSRTGTGQQWVQSIDSSGRLLFLEAASTGGTLYTRMSIDDTGEVGIGVTPASGIQLQLGNSSNNSAITRITNGTVHVDLTASSSGKAFLEVGTNHPLILATNATERMQITAAGNVGIGTSSPAAQLHVKSAGNGEIEVERTSGALINLQAQAAAGYIGTDSNHLFGLKANGTVRLKIATSGAISFNDAFTFPTADGSANQLLKTDGSGNMSWVTVSGAGTPSYIADGDGDTKIQVEESSDEDKIRFDTAGVERMIIDASGKVGIGTASPGSFVESSRFVVGSGASGTNEMMFLYSGTNTFGALGFADGTSGTEAYRGIMGYDHNTDTMFFSTAGGGNASRDMIIGSNGGVSIGTSTTTGSGGLLVSNDIKSNSRIGVGSGGNLSDAAIYRNSDTNTGIIWPAADTLGFTTGGVERLRFNSGGSALFNSASTALMASFDNTRSTGGYLRWMENGTASFFIGTSDTVGGGTGGFYDLYAVAGLGQRFFTGAAERMRIESGGNVGIGTTAPSNKLDVNGTIRAQGAITSVLPSSGGTFLSIGHTGNENWSFDAKSGSGSTDYVDFGLAGSTRCMTWQEDGNVGIGTTAPSYLVHAQNSTATGQSVMATSGNGQFIMAIGSQNSPGVAQEAFVGTLSNTRFKIKVNNVVKGSWTDGGLAIGTHSMASHLLHIKQPSSGDSTLMLETVSGGDPTIIFNSAAANRSGLIKYQDNGTNVGRIEYVHNGDRIDFQAGSATSATMSVKNGKVGIGTTNPSTQLEISNTASAVMRLSTSDTNVADNQEIGALEYYQADGSGAGAGVKASIRAKADNSTAAQTYLAFHTSDSSNNDIERLRINADGSSVFSGNVGIGVTPSAWAGTSTALQIGSLALEDYTVSGANVSVFYNNAFRNTAGNIVYKETDFASTYSQYNGEHSFSVAPSGTAGATISLTQALKITQSEIVANDGSADRDFRVESNGNANMLFVDGGNNRVGIGTSSPDSKMHLYDGALHVEQTDGSDTWFNYGSSNDNYITTGTGGITVFREVGSEKMRLSGGNLLVGTSTVSLYNSSSEVGSRVGDGVLMVNRSGLTPAYFNRLSNDGTIADFRKDGTSVGSIGTKTSDLYIGTTNGTNHCYLRFAYNNTRVVPSTNTGEPQDNALDLGDPNVRFKDLHLSGTANVGGNLVVTGNLTINGTTTTLNTATLNVEDKNITLNYGSGDTSSTADGAGITIQDAVNGTTDASLTWRASDDKFIFSHPLRMFNTLELPDNVKMVAGDGNDLQIYHDGSNSFIKNTTNDLYLDTASGSIHFTKNGTSEVMASFTTDGAVTLRHNNATKFATTSTGVSITGKTVFSDDITVGHSTTGTHSTSTSATTGIAIANFSKTSFRSAKFLVQVTNSTDSTYHTTEILVIHDGTDTYMTEYGSMFTGTAAEATFTSDVTGGGLVRLLATPASTDSMTFKVIRQNITV